MTMATTLLHVYEHGPDDVARALEAIFDREARPPALHLQGTYSAVLARLLSDELPAGYRYLVLRPHAGSAWTPLLEVGNRADGLDRALSEALDGAPVFSIFVYGDAIAGYRMARGGVEVDRYISDPEYLASLRTEESGDEVPPASVDGENETSRGHPERFADLLPVGTSPEDFARVVLRPGWWETHDGAAAAATAAGDAAKEATEEESVDEVDRARCIALALELWGPSAYPFAAELEEISNQEAGPAVALAFA